MRENEREREWEKVCVRENEMYEEKNLKTFSFSREDSFSFSQTEGHFSLSLSLYYTAICFLQLSTTFSVHTQSLFLTTSLSIYLFLSFLFDNFLVATIVQFEWNHLARKSLSKPVSRQSKQVFVYNIQT